MKRERRREGERREEEREGDEKEREGKKREGLRKRMREREKGVCERTIFCIFCLEPTAHCPVVCFMRTDAAVTVRRLVSLYPHPSIVQQWPQ